MSSAYKQKVHKKQSYTLSIARQRLAESNSLFTSENIGKVLIEGLKFSEHSDFSDFYIDKEDSFCIDYIEKVFIRDSIIVVKIATKKNHRRYLSVFLSIAFVETTKKFIMVQYSYGLLFSIDSLKAMFERILTDFCEAKDFLEGYFISIESISGVASSYYDSTIDCITKHIEADLNNGQIQLDLFEDDHSFSSNNQEYSNGYSESVYEDFKINLPSYVIGAKKLNEIYNCLCQAMPKEKISFGQLSLTQALNCEMISVAICHQMNWDFLRSAVLQKTLNSPQWIDAYNLSLIKAEDVAALLIAYTKPERIRADERAMILRILGTTFVGLKRGFSDIFFNDNGDVNSAEVILSRLSSCSVFTDDPIEKKLQLLLQKLSTYKDFESIGNICKPTIDYHLIRSFLRRQFLLPKTARGRELISSNMIRKEQTVGAIRKHCADLIVEISKVTKMSIASINTIEWWIGRTICEDEKPDCALVSTEADWLRGNFKECPFRSFCNLETMSITAPNYLGSSY